MVWEPFVGPAIVVAIAGISGLLWLVWRAYDRADKGLAEVTALELRIRREFASIGYLQDVERRIMQSLGRIETRLDQRVMHGGREGD